MLKNLLYNLKDDFWEIWYFYCLKNFSFQTIFCKMSISQFCRLSPQNWVATKHVAATPFDRICVHVRFWDETTWIFCVLRTYNFDVNHVFKFLMWISIKFQQVIVLRIFTVLCVLWASELMYEFPEVLKCALSMKKHHINGNGGIWSIIVIVAGQGSAW